MRTVPANEIDPPSAPGVHRFDVVHLKMDSLGSLKWDGSIASSPDKPFFPPTPPQDSAKVLPNSLSASPVRVGLFGCDTRKPMPKDFFFSTNINGEKNGCATHVYGNNASPVSSGMPPTPDESMDRPSYRDGADSRLGFDSSYNDPTDHIHDLFQKARDGLFDESVEFVTVAEHEKLKAKVREFSATIAECLTEKQELMGRVEMLEKNFTILEKLLPATDDKEMFDAYRVPPFSGGTCYIPPTTRARHGLSSEYEYPGIA